PSDHAVLFFALAMCIFFTHRKLGVLLLLHALLIVGLPRVYIGVHFPSDVAVGAVVGIVMALPMLGLTRLILRVNTLALEARYDHFFYAALFLVSSQASRSLNAAENLFPQHVG